MLFTEEEWADFVAYNPNFKESLLIKRVYADKDKQEEIIKGLKQGEELINKIQQIYTKNY